MAYNTRELRLLTSKFNNGGGGNIWTYDDTIAASVAFAANYISDASARGMEVGDKVIYRRYADLAAKTTAPTGYAEGWVTAVGSSGATIVDFGGTQPPVEDALSVTLTAAQSGSVCIFDKADGAKFILPAAAPGLEFEFVIAGTPSSVGHRIECASGDFLIGSILMDDGDTGLTTSAAAFNGSSHLACDMSEVAKGWLAGGFLKVSARTEVQWLIRGHLLHTGNVSSPAATS